MGRLFNLVGLVLAASLVFVSAEARADAQYASIVIDADTGQVLHEANADERTYPASLTKMMTLYLVFEALDNRKLRLDQRLTASRHSASQAPSKIGLEPGETIRVRDAILALVTKSANDVAATIAENLAGSEEAFAQQMTRKARALGMRNTVFRNASGLPDPDQYTTARDISRLSLALYRDFPHHYHYFATQDFTYRGVHYANHNHLMKSFDGMDGIKTGFIRASGFNLAASAMRENRRLIGVVMGGGTARARDAHMADLLNDAFAGRRSTTLVASRGGGDEVSTAERVLSRLSPVSTANAAPTKAASAPRRAAEAAGAWRIQIGAFSKKSAAERAAAAAATKIPGKKKPIQVLAPNRGEKQRVWRARLTNFSQSEAREACRILHKKRLQCAVISPSA